MFVIITMRLVNYCSLPESLDLEIAYRAAWRHFSEAVSQWQSLELKPDVPDKNDAELAVDSAEERYRQARNALAEYLLERSASQSDLRFMVRSH